MVYLHAWLLPIITLCYKSLFEAVVIIIVIEIAEAPSVIFEAKIIFIVLKWDDRLADDCKAHLHLELLWSGFRT